MNTNFNNKNNTNPNYYNPADLRNIIRLLWSQYVMWTRFLIISKISKLGDIEIVMNRLLELPMDFSNVLKVYYSEDIVNEFERLFREHLKLMIDYIDSVMANDQSKITTVDNDLQKNAEEIATFLSKINPYLDKSVLQNLLTNQIGMTKDEIQRRISNQYVSDIYQYDFIEYHALMIADIIWTGLISQFYH
jgi:hypothetical protein